MKTSYVWYEVQIQRGNHESQHRHRITRTFYSNLRRCRSSCNLDHRCIGPQPQNRFQTTLDMGNTRIFFVLHTNRLLLKLSNSYYHYHFDSTTSILKCEWYRINVSIVGRLSLTKRIGLDICVDIYMFNNYMRRYRIKLQNEEINEKEKHL